jgi:hypothetical protein
MSALPGMRGARWQEPFPETKDSYRFAFKRVTTKRRNGGRHLARPTKEGMLPAGKRFGIGGRVSHFVEWWFGYFLQTEERGACT